MQICNNVLIFFTPLLFSCKYLSYDKYLQENNKHWFGKIQGQPPSTMPGTVETGDLECRG